MKHTPQCIAWHEANERAATAYAQRWPHYCRTCNATGKGWDEEGETPCDDCLWSARCPRCHEPDPEDDDRFYACDFRCVTCGFDGDAGPGDDAPLPWWECYCRCWEFEDDAEEAEVRRLVAIGMEVVNDMIDDYPPFP